ncbi:MAG: hypothetical protein PHW83_10855, partial [Bacteroidales bacterium]|nr:hypothetical protein [Bacteroidales bacterium]
NFGLSYICEDFSSMIHSIKSVNIKTGKTIWAQSVHKSGMIRDIINNDSVVHILTDKFIGSYSFEKGEIWYIPIELKVIDRYSYTEEDLAISALGTFTGIFTGFYFYSLGSVEHIFVSGSNLHYSSNMIFYADSQSLKAINAETGAIIWEKILPEHFVGMSQIIEHDGKIIVVNTSVYKKGNKILRNSKPGVIAVDKNKGDIISELGFENYGKSIVEIKHQEDLLYIKTDSHYLSVSLNSIELLSAKSFNQINEHNSFENKDNFYTYSLSDNAFTKQIEHSIVISSENAYSYFCDPYLNVLDSIYSADFTKPVYRNDQEMIFQYKDDVYFTNSTGEVIMRFPKAQFVVFINDRLYFTHNRSLFHVDIN